MHVERLGRSKPVHIPDVRHQRLARDDPAGVAGEPLPAIKTLAVKDVRGKGTLRIGPASCPVVLVAQQLGSGVQGAAFDWQRPLSETARSTGGPIIECAEPAQRVHTSKD